MRRRSILRLAGGTAIALARPLAAQTPTRVFRIGVLSRYVRRELWPVMPALREIGYEEPRNVVFDFQFSNGNSALLDAMAADLAAKKLDLILTVGGFEAAAVRRFTSTIPIVASALGPDPVQAGYVASLARPGANLTGVTGPALGTFGKSLHLLRQMVPGLARLASLTEPSDAPNMRLYNDAFRRDMAAMGVANQLRTARDQRELDAAFEAIARERPDALNAGMSGFIFVQRAQIIAFAAQQRLPAMYGGSVRPVAEGGLMAYSMNTAAVARRVAVIVDKVLKGANPADIPVEQPTHYDFQINLRTARAMGLVIPQSVLLQATEVIE